MISVLLLYQWTPSPLGWVWEGLSGPTAEVYESKTRFAFRGRLQLISITVTSWVDAAAHLQPPSPLAPNLFYSQTSGLFSPSLRT